jgi:hypothetical protein
MAFIKFILTIYAYFGLSSIDPLQYHLVMVNTFLIWEQLITW